jgi:succinate-acetate transporter protein
LTYGANAIAFGYGGIASLIAGMWDFALGNTFGALVFTSYGGFWISFATIYIPAFNISNAPGYVNNPDEFLNAVGHYLICMRHWNQLTQFGLFSPS